MAKPVTTNLKVRPSLQSICFQVVKDLRPYLPVAFVDKCIIALSFEGVSEFERVVESELGAADCLASSKYLTLAALRQLQALYKKNVNAPGSTPQCRKDEAQSKFLTSELKCWYTNERIRSYESNRFSVSDDMNEIVGMTRDIIADIMGPMGPIDFVKVCSRAGFGPGFTFGSTSPDHRNLYYKVAGPHTVTSDALPYVKVMLNHTPMWKSALLGEDASYDVVGGNRITTVPKDSSTDRTIAIEPSFNVYIQKGVDSVLKGRLLRNGIDLSDQTRNHAPAKEGSQRPLHAATVDLSMASDTVSIETARLLLPPSWYVLMSDLRSKNYTTDKGVSWNTYEKFSSMGNAFTFPLETLIFYGVAKACTIQAGGSLSVLRVYGDDIIIDPKAYLLLVELLSFLGFTTNPDKSFVFGSFRETCGSDFYSGVDLRPTYLKKVPRNDQEVYNLFNRLLWNRVGFRFHNVCEYLFDCVDKPLIGPASLAAGAKYWLWEAGKSVHYDHWFHAPPDAGIRFRRFDTKLNVSNWRIQVLRFIPKKMDISSWNNHFHYLSFLLGNPGIKEVGSNSRFRRVVNYEIISYWPAPPWRPYLYDCKSF